MACAKWWRPECGAWVVGKHVGLGLVLTGLVVVLGLNLAGALSLGLGSVGGALFVATVVALAAAALRASVKAVWCFALSSWMTIWRRGVNLRLLLLQAYAWADFDTWTELGPWALVVLPVWALPLYLAAFASFAFDYSTTFGPPTSFWNSSAGIGGHWGNSGVRLVTSEWHMLNQTLPLLSGKDPRWFCWENLDDASFAGSVQVRVHVPGWPLADLGPWGTAGKRITITGAKGYTFTSNCSLSQQPPPVPPGSQALDSGNPSVPVYWHYGLEDANNSISFFQQYSF